MSQGIRPRIFPRGLTARAADFGPQSTSASKPRVGEAPHEGRDVVGAVVRDVEVGRLREVVLVRFGVRALVVGAEIVEGIAHEFEVFFPGDVSTRSIGLFTACTGSPYPKS